MNKISEQKALEAYPIKIRHSMDSNRNYREGYIVGYDKAMQDIKEFIYDKFNIHPHDCHVVQYDSDIPLKSMDDFVKQIEKYIENELLSM